MKVTLIAIELLFASGLVVPFFGMHSAAHVVSVQFTREREFIREEQEFAAIFVVQKFSIKRMYCVQHIAVSYTHLTLPTKRIV